MDAPAPIRVLTVDRLPLVHAGVRQLLSPFPDIAIVGEAFALADLPCQPARLAATIVLLDIDDLGGDWPGVLPTLTRDGSGVRVVVFTLTATPERVHQALRAGVHGYLLKQIEPLALAQALRSIAAGQQVLDPEAANALLYARRTAASLGDQISQREREVLTLLAAGLSNQAIAAHLCVSRATVKFHCGNLFGKLSVRTRGEAIAAAFAHNLVPPVVASGGQRQPAHLGVWPEPRLRRA